ncbi:MAG: hypothetical protein KF683_15380 [Rubrivivax sp.]|nr:hypothetical protein [Rubrivivax sp.]
MPLPFAVAAVAALAAGGYHYYKKNARSNPVAAAYRLPPCCRPVLERTNHYGTLAGVLGVTVSTAKLLGDANPANAPFLVTTDWPAEGQAHADVADGLHRVLATYGLLDKVFDHYSVHAREDSDAQRFWTAVYKRTAKQHGHKTNYGGALKVLEEIDEQFRPR